MLSNKRLFHIRVAPAITKAYILALVFAGSGPLNLAVYARAQSNSVSVPKLQTALPLERQSAAGGKLAFEVASVRPSSPEEPFGGNITLDALDSGAFPGGIVSTNAPLALYIIFAYKIADTSQYQSLNAQLPKWAQDGRFHIEARTEGSPTRDELRLMMQSLLEDRFKLTVHVASAQAAVYQLTLLKSNKLGPMLRIHSAQDVCINRPNKVPPISPDVVSPHYCGATGWQVRGQVHLRMIDVSMDQVADYLSGVGTFGGDADHRSIINGTGLPEHYDLDLEFTPSTSLSTDQSEENSPDNLPGLSAKEALKSELGLTLTKRSAVVPKFIIDRVEELTPN
jgi:uncharacterized protein (TIGR03435 family)